MKHVCVLREGSFGILKGSKAIGGLEEGRSGEERGRRCVEYALSTFFQDDICHSDGVCTQRGSVEDRECEM